MTFLLKGTARIAEAFACGLVSFVAQAVGIFAWCLVAFGCLGYRPSEVVHVAPLCLVLPAFSVLDRGASYVFTRLRPMQGPGHAAIGFMIAAGLASLWILLLGERPMDAANLHDMALAGLVFGIPAGLVAHECSKGARTIVDRFFRVL